MENEDIKKSFDSLEKVIKDGSVSVINKIEKSIKHHDFVTGIIQKRVVKLNDKFEKVNTKANLTIFGLLTLTLIIISLYLGWN